MIVFIGPCASKKLEASRRTVRSDVAFVITFEELMGMFEAKGVLLEEIMISGNFGHTDERMADIATNRWTSFWFINGKTFRFWRFDHWAWFWSPVWRIYHFIWRKAKGFS